MKIMDWKPRVLVIGPGGAKGFVTLGFLVPLEDHKHLQNINVYCGVSIGAVISLLLVCGYSIREIIGQAVMVDLAKELHNFNFQSTINNRGLISHEPTRNMLTELVLAKFNTIPTLGELYQRTGKSLVTVTLNATDNTCVFMDKNTTPNISCVEATLFSMNIPFVFYQLIHEGKTYVDGGLANPYPVNYFDDGNTNILGIFMKGNPNISNALTFADYADKIIHSLMEQMRLLILQNSSDKCRHVCLTTDVDDMIGYKVTLEDKADMLILGEKRGREYLRNYQSPFIPLKSSYQYS